MAPPGWPEPPSGWAPPVGWHPDPSWPEPPAGWQWWQRTRRSAGERVGLTVGFCAVVVAIILGILLVAAEAFDTVAGCGSIDPTDAANYSKIDIVNDTPRTVVLDECTGTQCLLDQLPARLAAGESLEYQAACGVSGVDMTSWRVRTLDGHDLGYIAVDSPRSQSGLVFDVSSASPDRQTPTRPR
jgi:hypothetical protein